MMAAPPRMSAVRTGQICGKIPRLCAVLVFWVIGVFSFSSMECPPVLFFVAVVFVFLVFLCFSFKDFWNFKYF